MEKKQILVMGPQLVRHSYWLEVASIIGERLARHGACILMHTYGEFIHKAMEVASKQGGLAKQSGISFDGLIMVGGDMRFITFLNNLIRHSKKRGGTKINLGLLAQSMGATDAIITALPSLHLPANLCAMVERNPRILTQRVIED